LSLRAGVFVVLLSRKAYCSLISTTLANPIPTFAAFRFLSIFLLNRPKFLVNSPVPSAFCPFSFRNFATRSTSLFRT
jgi:hypothetical protein